MLGWIYIFKNQSMPGLLKIGSTERHPTDRLNELSKNTSCPLDFECYAAWYVEVDDLIKVECDIHQLYFESRINKRREFFRLNAEEASFEVFEFLNNFPKCKIKDHIYECSETLEDKYKAIVEDKISKRKDLVDFSVLEIINRCGCKFPIYYESESYFKKVVKDFVIERGVVSDPDEINELKNELESSLNNKNNQVINDARLEKERRISAATAKALKNRANGKHGFIESQEQLERAKQQIENARANGKKRRLSGKYKNINTMEKSGIFEKIRNHLRLIF